MYITKRMILVEVAKEPKKFDDGAVSYCHTFMDKDGKEFLGFCPNDLYRAEVQPTLAWDDSKAKDWILKTRSYQGQEKPPRLLEKTEALGVRKSLGLK